MCLRFVTPAGAFGVAEPIFWCLGLCEEYRDTAPTEPRLEGQGNVAPPALSDRQRHSLLRGFCRGM